MRLPREVRIGGTALLVALSACTARSLHSPAAIRDADDSDAERTRAHFERVLAQAAAEPGAKRTRSGMVYRELAAGRGAVPSGDDTVTLRYQTKTESGEIVGDSAAEGGAVTVVLAQIGTCEREALTRMRAGGTSRFVCPLREKDLEARPVPRRPVPLFIEVTLIDVGRPLPAPGH